VCLSGQKDGLIIKRLFRQIILALSQVGGSRIQKYENRVSKFASDAAHTAFHFLLTDVSAPINVINM
jgi:hypothetical protein